METPDLDARNASSLLSHPAWSSYYRPRLEEAFKKHLNSLASKRSEGDDILRGWIAALNWALTFPQIDIDEYSRMVDEQKQAEAEENEDDQRVTQGFHSPFLAEKEH